MKVTFYLGFRPCMSISDKFKDALPKLQMRAPTLTADHELLANYKLKFLGPISSLNKGFSLKLPKVYSSNEIRALHCIICYLTPILPQLTTPSLWGRLDGESIWVN